MVKKYPKKYSAANRETQAPARSAALINRADHRIRLEGVLCKSIILFTGRLIKSLGKS